MSSYLGGEPHNIVRRCDRKRKEHINVTRPHVLVVYNMSMGGIDILGMNTSSSQIGVFLSYFDYCSFKYSVCLRTRWWCVGHC